VQPASLLGGRRPPEPVTRAHVATGWARRWPGVGLVISGLRLARPFGHAEATGRTGLPEPSRLVEWVKEIPAPTRRLRQRAGHQGRPATRRLPALDAWLRREGDRHRSPRGPVGSHTGDPARSLRQSNDARDRTTEANCSWAAPTAVVLPALALVLIAPPALGAWAGVRPTGARPLVRTGSRSRRAGMAA
jgi:hypothetical protein